MALRQYTKQDEDQIKAELTRSDWLMQHEVCTRSNFFGELAGKPCADCGHVNLLHMNRDCCLVCEIESWFDDQRRRVE